VSAWSALGVNAGDATQNNGMRPVHKDHSSAERERRHFTLAPTALAMKPIQGGLKHTDVHAKYGKIAIEKLSTDFRSRSLAEQS